MPLNANFSNLNVTKESMVINEKAHNPAIPADILHFIRSLPKLNLSKAPSIRNIRS